MSGLAEAEVMRAKGYNQKDVLQAEVQKAYAEGIGNMTINGSGGNIAGDMIGLSMGIAMAGAVTPQVDNMFSAMSSTNADATKSSGAKCTKCGADLPENAKFCLECGEKVVADGMIVCPECGNTVAKGKFCPECGHKFVTACPKCGVELIPGAKFCPECGEKL